MKQKPMQFVKKLISSLNYGMLKIWINRIRNNIGMLQTVIIFALGYDRFGWSWYYIPIGVLFILQGRGLQLIGEIGSNFGSPESIGLELFRQYLLPFEITSILLLVAMIGAIVLTRDD